MRSLLDSPRTQIMHVSPGSFHETLGRVEACAEHRLSLTDCTNVVLVERLHLDGLFAFDEGCRRVGVRVVPVS